MAFVVAELTWLAYIFRDIGIILYMPPTLFRDNLSALYMTINLVFHARAKYIEIDYHFVREKVALGSLVTKFIASNKQIADVFTKPGYFQCFTNQTWTMVPTVKFEGE